ncbi:hypothetical protein U3516DRAFT_735165 [Neocallimastix sp. 'constans']
MMLLIIQLQCYYLSSLKQHKTSEFKATLKEKLLIIINIPIRKLFINIKTTTSTTTTITTTTSSIITPASTTEPKGNTKDKNNIYEQYNEYKPNNIHDPIIGATVLLFSGVVYRLTMDITIQTNDNYNYKDDIL